ncbi:MAG TPA: hypothetical protein VMG14_07375 [Thermoplasmata archaeon]|nr:hypothetical protein [Thermoplasmata archaeon]
MPWSASRAREDDALVFGAGPFRTRAEFDPFSIAVGFAVLAGALAVLLPFLDSLTVTLAALAAAAWAWRRRRSVPTDALRPTALEWLGWGCVGLGAGAFVLCPPPWSVARGFLLGASLVPLWWVDRADRRRRGPRGGRP